MKEFSCKDAGMDCGWVAKGANDEEILAKATAHAKKDHGMAEVPQEMVAKIRSLIHEA
jgi:predicted small metal-binding protein